jgi:hypothetical protein
VTPAPGAQEADTVIQAPPSWRPARPPAAALAAPTPASPVSAQLSPSREVSAAPRLPPAPRQGTVDRQRASPDHTAGPAQSSVPSRAEEALLSPEASVPRDPTPLPAFQAEARATPLRPGQQAPALAAAPARRVARETPAPGALEAGPVIQAPLSLRPAAPPVAALAAPTPAGPVSAQLSSSREASAASRLPPAPRQGAVAADIARPHQTATTAGASATVEVDYSRRSDAQRLPGQVTPALDVGPVPPRPVPSVGPPTSPMGRQSRITIGRIDVQVNNHPPALPSSPPPPMTYAFPSHSLETRFLNRFPMRP